MIHSPSKNLRRKGFRKEQGLSLIELMIAITIGLLILAGLLMIFVSGQESRNELAKSNRQIENGRYAIEELRKEIQLAGFWGEYSAQPLPTWTWADPCSTRIDTMGFGVAGYSWNTAATGNFTLIDGSTVAMGNTMVPVGIFGYRNEELAASTIAVPTCINNWKSGTDILVIRRASTKAINIDADGNNAVDTDVDTNEDGVTDAVYTSLGNASYLQVSHCSDIPAENAFVVDHDMSKFTLHKAIPAGSPSTCLSGSLSTVRQLVTQIYYISTCNDCSGTGDGIPTLKVAELSPASAACATAATTSCGSWAVKAIAEGIENMQIEYGLDTPTVDGAPDMYSAAAIPDWSTVVAVKLFLLARTIETSPGYTDNKTYNLSSDNSTQYTPASGERNYKRHVYTASVMATNIAGRRMP